MRIAFVPAARLLSDREPNGESLIAVALLRALAARGHEVIAFCERAETAVDGVDIREISAAGRTSGSSRIAFARRVARAAAAERYDVAHLLFPATTADGYAPARGPLVVGPLNLPWPGATRAQRLRARVAAAVTDPLERRMHARTLARASRVLVTGASALEALPASVRERSAVLPFGVDLAHLAPTPLPAEPVVVFLSVLSERKGVEVLLRALPALRARVPDARVIVAGADPGEMRVPLSALAAELGVAGAVEFTGPVAPRDRATVFARARVVCQPSFGEPFGMTVIEAMASGRAVVATRAGGIPDAVVDGVGGRLVPPGDPAALAAALAGVLGDDAVCARMGAANRARAEETYALERVVGRLEEHYRAVTGKEASHVAA